MNKFKNHKISAFSLIELSVVILIIGILVAGVTQSSRLIAQFRLKTAQNLTINSPVSSIKNLSTWY
jgi:prepilin-type N-terminal cleavage/methylation domain-containing protein